MNASDPLFQWMQSPENNNLLILMRGLPASGKSYRARELANGDESVICSADHFFGRTKEEYVANWTKEKLHIAHRVCQRKVQGMMQRQLPLVIVDNTNTCIAEMMPYFDMAVQYRYRVQIEEPTSPWWVNDIAPYLLDKALHKDKLEAAARLLTEKNQETHCVPLESIQKMLNRYQPMVLFSDLVNVYCRGKMGEAEKKEIFDYLGHYAAKTN
jgi:predicted kinase